MGLYVVPIKYLKLPSLVRRPRYILLVIICLVAVAALAVLYVKHHHNHSPGIYLTGPRTVALNTDYTYQLTVVTDKSYKDAALFIGVPESQYSRLQHFNITAGQPFTESFTTSYDSTYQLTTAGINTYLASSSPATGSYLIYTQQFPMKLSSSHQATGKKPATPPPTSSTDN